MTVYTNIAGTWTTVSRPYVKRSGVHAPVKQVWVKRAGVWTLSYDFDVIPPPAPEIILTVIDGRYIRVGVRGSASTHDPEMAMIRTLVGTSTAYPANQYGSTYISGADTTYPTEPWSEVRYNGYLGGTHNTTSIINKEYPLNVSSTYDLPGGRRYYFQSWAMDLHGNWSVGTQANIFMPTTGDTSQVVKHARFSPIGDGNVRSNTYFDEELEVKSGQDVMLYYGGAMAQSMRQNQPVVTITSAQILLYRKVDDGAPLANVYLLWHNVDGVGWFSGSAIHSATYVGQIAKGQAKWFALPAAHITNLASEAARGFGLYYKNPTAAAAQPEDYLKLYRHGDETGSIVNGQLDLIWTEKPA